MYHSGRLYHGPIEGYFDESVRLRVVVMLWVSAFLGMLIVDIIGGVLALILILIGVLNFAVLFVLGPLVSVVAFWLLFLLSKTHEPISEWNELLENRADVATSAYAAIYGSLARRRIPVRSQATRMRTDILPDVVTNRLVITERSYQAYVTVFAYGTSLYMGWMMWRNRRGATLVGTYLKDLIGRILLRTDPVRQMLRTEKVRAMREAVHTAVREGVNIAIERREVPMAATFGYDIPVKGFDQAAAPPPPPPPPPGGSWNPPSGGDWNAPAVGWTPPDGQPHEHNGFGAPGTPAGPPPQAFPSHDVTPQQ